MAKNYFTSHFVHQWKYPSASAVIKISDYLTVTILARTSTFYFYKSTYKFFSYNWLIFTNNYIIYIYVKIMSAILSTSCYAKLKTLYSHIQPWPCNLAGPRWAHQVGKVANRNAAEISAKWTPLSLACPSGKLPGGSVSEWCLLRSDSIP